jgi:O-antigen ligase
MKNCPVDPRFLAVATAIGVTFAVFIHVPAPIDALNYFDPPKRLVWSLVCLMLASVCLACGESRRSKSVVLELILLAWIIVRTLTRPMPFVELGVLFTWCLPVMLFLLGREVSRKLDVRLFCRIIAIGGLAQSVLMLCQRLGFDPFFSTTTAVMEYKPERMIGTVGYHNMAADFLGISAAAVLLTRWRRWVRFLGLSLIFVVIGFTASRGRVLAFVTAVLMVSLVWAWTRSAWTVRKKSLVSLATVCIAVCGLGSMLLIPELRERVVLMLHGAKQSTAIGSRFIMLDIGWRMICEHPLFGWGAGEYAYQYLLRLGDVVRLHAPHEVLRCLVFAREAHNDYVQFVVEFGLLGFGILSSVVVMELLRLTRLWRYQESRSKAFFFIVVYMGVSSAFSFPWQAAVAGPFAALMLGIFWPTEETLTGMHTAASHVSLRYHGFRYTWFLCLSFVSLMWWLHLSYLDLAIPRMLAQGRVDDAERTVPPFVCRYRALVGAGYAAEGRFDEAGRVLKGARLGYRDVLLWNNLGNALTKQGKWKEALDVYSLWARCGLGQEEALANVSVACEQLGLIAEAAEALGRKIGTWPPGTPTEIKRLSLLYYKLADFKAARHVLLCRRELWEAKDARTRAEIYNLLGAIALGLCEKEAAIDWFRCALDADPALQSAKLNLNALFSDTKNTGAATVGHGK